MTFLPLAEDAELTGSAAAAKARVEASGRTLTNVDRALLGHLPSYHAYSELQSIRDELVPYIGERAVTLFAYAITRATGAATPTASFRRTLMDDGEDPDDPQVTETERLLLDWGAQIGTNPAAVTDDFAARLERAFSPKLRLLLVAFAGQVVAATVFATAGRVPLDDELRPYGA